MYFVVLAGPFPSLGLSGTRYPLGSNAPRRVPSCGLTPGAYGRLCTALAAQLDVVAHCVEMGGSDPGVLGQRGRLRHLSQMR